MLEISRISKSYGDHPVLTGLDLKIEEGALYGLMGRNGAGKTTLLRICAGLLRPDSGEVRVDGISYLENAQAVRESIGYVPDEFGTYDRLTAMEYLEFYASAFGIYDRTGRTRCEELLSAVGLADRADDEVNTLSRGMQQRLSIARAIIHDPKILVLDEPTSGLDPVSRHAVKELLGELCMMGKTILISSHVLSELSELCTDIGILDGGRMKLTGSMERIMKRVENANPLKITVLNGAEEALRILRQEKCVRSVAMDKNTFSIGFDGDMREAAELLHCLIENDIPVSGFMREPGSLEALFLQMTADNEDKVIMKNDPESDLY